jgi:hypothetical protein
MARSPRRARRLGPDAALDSLVRAGLKELSA